MKKVVGCILLAAFLFGTMEVALKIGGNSFDPLQLTFLRFFIGGCILAPFGVAETRRNGTKFSRGDLLWLVLTGLMGVAVSMLAYQLGVQRCNAATAAVLMCLNPLFTMAIAHVFTADKMNRTKGLACLIGLVAAIFMIRPWDIQPGNTALGMALMLVASSTFAAYSVMGKKTIGRLGTFTQTSISFIFGSMGLLIAIIATGRPIVQNIAANPLTVLYCGIAVTGLGYLFYFLAIRYSDATTGSITFFIKPAVAPVLAILILHETVTWNTVLGIVLLLTASVITLRDKWADKRVRQEAEAAEDTEDALLEEAE